MIQVSMINLFRIYDQHVGNLLNIIHISNSIDNVYFKWMLGSFYSECILHSTHIWKCCFSKNSLSWKQVYPWGIHTRRLTPSIYKTQRVTFLAAFVSSRLSLGFRKQYSHTDLIFVKTFMRCKQWLHTCA